MTTTRKTGDVREKDLRLAIGRIQHGRTKTGDTKLTFAAVAREAGVSTALIHNCYPKIADEIREAQGRSAGSQRDAKRHELLMERKKSRELRSEIEDLRAKVAMLASVNEVLQIENRDLQAQVNDPRVVGLGRTGDRSPWPR